MPTLKLICEASSAASRCISLDFSEEVSLGRIVLLALLHDGHVHSWDLGSTDVEKSNTQLTTNCSLRQNEGISCEDNTGGNKKQMGSVVSG